ncbi:MAG: nucleotidyl transferase AbiEii/AbiGii toxin family protein [Oligoflexales bacterium]|nr:nucleotidyl transferase AbiEii/AbiGii toxin family protein [Oligoflexales bacterium]
MSELIKQRVRQANAKNTEQEKMVLQELIQEISLLGLWRSKFFEHAAFYGGTSLRILYGLDRFSEDLDFTLLKKDQKFDLNKYTRAIKHELESFDIEASVERKEKNIQTAIESAFIKTDSQICFIVAASKFKAQKGSLIKVKIEIDTDAVPGFQTEAKQFFWPQPFSVLTCDLPSLFAGKIHATFCRGLRNYVKGRDWYDVLWYVGQRVRTNWQYLEEKVRDSGHWKGDFSPELFRCWAKDQVENLDVSAARRDVERFITQPQRLDAWSKELFCAAIDSF